MARGKLVFKGEKRANKKKSSSSKNKLDDGSHLSLSVAVAVAGGGEAIVGGATTISSSTLPPDATGEGENGKLTNETKNPMNPKINDGKGLISTSQCVCSGNGTTFKTQLRAGDAIIARTQKGIDEMRVITMVLSNVSISISSPFSSDLRIPTSWQYINKPRNDAKEKAAKAQMARQEKEDVETRAMGTYGDKGEIIYREKTVNGGYRIRKEKATEDHTRSDLLAYRAKKKSDRYC